LMQCMCDSARQMGRLGDINSHGIAWVRRYCRELESSE
jgi:hypothetical protein